MHIAIIGGHFSSLKNYMDSAGVEYTVFKDALKYKKQLPHTVYVDFSDLESLVETVGKHHKRKPFDVALTLYEQYIVSTALINDRLGLPGLGLEAAKACTDKSIMRALFAKASKKISPEFRLVDSVQSLEDFADSHSFPLMLKPANLAKSLLVIKNDNKEELLKNYQKMLERMDKVYEKYAPHNERLVLVEEYLEGSIHSVDAFVDAEGKPTVLPYIVDYQTGYDIGYNDNFHYSRIMPTKLSQNSQEDFIETAEIAIRSLEMKNTAAHVEIIVTKDGPRIVEIGARNGGYRERMHAAAQGINLYDNLLRTATGRPLRLNAVKNEPCAVLELFPRSLGAFIEIVNEEKLRSLDSLRYCSVKYKKGDLCGKSSDGYKAACVIMLHNSDPEQFQLDLTFVNDNVYAVSEPAAS